MAQTNFKIVSFDINDKGLNQMEEFYNKKVRTKKNTISNVIVAADKVILITETQLDVKEYELLYSEYKKHLRKRLED